MKMGWEGGALENYQYKAVCFLSVCFVSDHDSFNMASSPSTHTAMRSYSTAEYQHKAAQEIVFTYSLIFHLPKISLTFFLIEIWAKCLPQSLPQKSTTAKALRRLASLLLGDMGSHTATLLYNSCWDHLPAGRDTDDTDGWGYKSVGRILRQLRQFQRTEKTEDASGLSLLLFNSQKLNFEQQSNSITFFIDFINLY